MNRQLRRFSIALIAKQAGIVSDLVEKFLSKPKSYRSLGSVGPGTTVMVPENPVKSDGSVDIIIQVRGIPGGDIKSAASVGKGAVVVTAEAGGIGSKENFMAYSSTNFISKTTNQIIEFLKSKPEFANKNVHLGKLTISSFSGGGSAVANLLKNRDSLPKGSVPPKFVFIDGLHADPKATPDQSGKNAFQAVAEFAQQVRDDPSAGELSIVTTKINPGKYIATDQVAQQLLAQIGMKDSKRSQWGDIPVTEHQQGGLHIARMYDDGQPYMVKDPRTGQMKPNIPGTSGYQHIQALSKGLARVV